LKRVERERAEEAESLQLTNLMLNKEIAALHEELEKAKKLTSSNY